MLKFQEYPWTANDIHLVDEAAPWHQWFLGRADSPHVTLAALPIPLMHRYDGPHWHRLTRLALTA